MTIKTPSDYDAWREMALTLYGEPAVWVGKPGVWNWDELNPGTAALIDVLPPELSLTDRVLDLGCGTGLIGLAAARLAREGQVDLVDVNLAAVNSARCTLDANELENAQVHLADGVASQAHYDAILSHLPRGRAVVEALLRQAFVALEPEGRFIFVAHKRAGVKSAIAYARQIFGGANVIRQKKGYHVALALKKGQANDVQFDEDAGYVSRQITLQNVPTILVSKPGVFAWERLDAGTAALLEAVPLVELSGKTVLDLGCGAGLLALAAARCGANVVAVDVDLRAVESARCTLAANGAEGAVLISDCAQAVLERKFDAVLCNPPFHRGVGVEFDVARQMLRSAAQVLRPGGCLYVISNAFIRYEREMRGLFSRVQQLYDDGRYRVWQAQV